MDIIEREKEIKPKKENKMDKLNFRSQIAEDLDFIGNEYERLDINLKKTEYAFNFWVLTKLYNLDEEIAVQNITEYNDKNIDCFVHFEESKELFIIQNKYYDEDTPLDRKYVSDFLTTPITQLRNENYKKNQELQEIFKNAISNNEYKIFLHFYITNNNKSKDIDMLINNFNKKQRSDGAFIEAKIFYLNDIYQLYYGQSYKEDIKFSHVFRTINKGTVLKILPEDYNLPGMSEAYYIMTPITDIYILYKKAKQNSYPLFEENIREYLGKTSINTAIVKTLKDKDDRKNFFYYNNGITIICDNLYQESKGSYLHLTLDQPQIVNGCQTVNTIYEVLQSYNDNELQNEFKGVYAMVKVFVQKGDRDRSKYIKFYRNVVKYTNSQNAINEKAFASANEYFLTLQKSFKERGFLLLVKPSDKNKFKTELNDKTKISEMLVRARKYVKETNIELKSISDIMIPIDKILQVFLAYVKDGYYAYTKKNYILKPNSEIYNNYSRKINNYLTIDNMIRLFLFFKKAELDRKNSEDKKTPIPYYLIGFLGYFIPEDNKTPEKLNSIMEQIFTKEGEFEKIYNYLKRLTNLYKDKYKSNYNIDYNVMIKKKIDIELLNEQISTLRSIGDEASVNEFLKFCRK